MSESKKVLKLGDLEIGKGMPKICAPIAAVNMTELAEQIEELAKIAPDMVEWRADYFPIDLDREKIVDILRKIKDGISCPLIATLRTGAEGGVRSVSDAYYEQFNRNVIASGLADIVDIEAFFNRQLTKDLIEMAELNGIKVLTSNHDFEKTPEKEELVRRLAYMEKIGGDIAKIAVMAKSKEDTLSLMLASVEAEKQVKIPIVTMAMGRYGLPSRIAGEFSGSAMSFASGVKTTAAGQMETDDLRNIFEALHRYHLKLL